MAARGRASWSSGWSAPPRRRRSAAQRLLEQLKEHRTRDWRGVLTRGLHGDMQRSGLHLPVKVPRHGVSRCARSVFLRARRPIRDNFIHTPYEPKKRSTERSEPKVETPTARRLRNLSGHCVLLHSTQSTDTDLAVHNSENTHRTQLAACNADG